MGGNGEELMISAGNEMQGVVLSSGGADGTHAVGILKAAINRTSDGGSLSDGQSARDKDQLAAASTADSHLA